MSVYNIISKISLALVLSLANMAATKAQTISKDSTEYEVNDYDAGYNAITMTPFTIPKGSLVYQNLMLGINTLEYGVTDNLSVATGVSLFNFTGRSVRNPPIFLSLKYKIYDEDGVAVSLASLNSFQRFKYHSDLEGSDSYTETYHALFLNTAFYKDKNNFFTLGVGAYGSAEFMSVIFTAGFSKRTSKSTAFIGDLWLPVFDLESDITAWPFPALGFRYFLKSGITVDFGFPFVGMKIPLLK